MIVNLTNALLITAVGMSLVFVSILLLWGLMAALVRIAGLLQNSVEDKDHKLHKIRRQAAAIAVSVAMAQQVDATEPHEFPQPPTPLVSAWQAVMRTKMHSKRGPSR
jgi:hypothetical protein